MIVWVLETLRLVKNMNNLKVMKNIHKNYKYKGKTINFKRMNTKGSKMDFTGIVLFIKILWASLSGISFASAVEFFMSNAFIISCLLFVCATSFFFVAVFFRLPNKQL